MKSQRLLFFYFISFGSEKEQTETKKKTKTKPGEYLKSHFSAKSIQTPLTLCVILCLYIFDIHVFLFFFLKLTVVFCL